MNCVAYCWKLGITVPLKFYVHTSFPQPIYYFMKPMDRRIPWVMLLKYSMSNCGNSSAKLIYILAYLCTGIDATLAQILEMRIIYETEVWVYLKVAFINRQKPNYDQIKCAFKYRFSNWQPKNINCLIISVETNICKEFTFTSPQNLITLIIPFTFSGGTTSLTNRLCATQTFLCFTTGYFRLF